MFFDVDEYALFEKWLDHQSGEKEGYQSPTYIDAQEDVYLVIENESQEVVGCGGYYVVKDLSEARLAWGMIHRDFHHEGYGSLLYQFRAEEIISRWPKIRLTLGTSQHTYQFYQKMGMKVVEIVHQGYGPDLDQYNMEVSSDF